MLDLDAPLQWELADSDELVAYRRGQVTVVLNVSDHEVTLPVDLVPGGEVIVSSARGHANPATVPADACTWLLRR
jgi:hypothetical protein